MTIPHQVCQRCESLIKDFDDFQKFVLKNQEDLLKYKTKKIPLAIQVVSDNIDEEAEFCHVSPIQDCRYENYRCKICHKQMYNKDEYDIHTFYHDTVPKSKIGMFICDICGRDFQSERYLTKHHKQHVTEPQTCPICDKEYENFTRLETHLVRFHIPFIYLTCDICSRICRNKEVLQSHIGKMHKEKETAKCVKCNVVLKDYSSLQRHNRIKHSINALRHICKFCGKGFARKLSWEDHEASHLNLAKYQCEFCDKRFVSNSNFCSHRVKSHPKEYAMMKEERKRKQYCNVLR